MRKVMTISKQSGKVTLPTLVGNGTIKSAALPLKDTPYYQVGANGDYIQEKN
jgi:hypothetical protein